MKTVKGRLGGLSEENQDGLVVCLPQFDKVCYNINANYYIKNLIKLTDAKYMGFINCKARGIRLDPELQQDIAKDYKPGDGEDYSIASTSPKEEDESNDGEPDKPEDPEARRMEKEKILVVQLLRRMI